MDFTTLILIVIVVGIIACGASVLFKNKPTFNQLTKKAKKIIYDLFLTAEKENWVNEDKMQWCVEELSKYFSRLKINIDQTMIKLIAQYLYDKYKETAKTLLKDSE